MCRAYQISLPFCQSNLMFSGLFLKLNAVANAMEKGLQSNIHDFDGSLVARRVKYSL